MSDTTNKSLLVDWGTTLLVHSAPSKNGFNLMADNRCPFKENWRLPWDMVDKTDLYKMNYHVSLAPDPKHTMDFYDTKFAHKVLRTCLKEIKNQNLYKNIIIVYEYGDKGKKYGKLHWHILLDTKNIRKIEKIFNNYFATCKSRSKNTTWVKRITPRNALACSTPEELVAGYKESVDYIMKKYMQKETQNKVKCLYTNMRKEPIDI